MIWLASGSPRRRELLAWAGWTVDVRPADIDETRRPEHDPVTHALRLAREKAATGADDRIVVAADTIVHRGNELFEKPADGEEAGRHLRALSGGWHLVTTAVCVRLGLGEPFAVTTRVRFRTLGEDEIAAYVATGEAYGKAGAYAIQGVGGALVAEVQGSWTNVMGLPLEETDRALRALGARRG